MSFTDSWNAFFRKPAPNIVLRTVVLLAGFAFIAMGIAVSRSTNMGVSCISAVPNVCSYITDKLTLGQITLIWNAFFMLVQIALLRRNYKPVQLLQIVCTVPFAAMIDFFVPIAAAIPQPNYAVNWLFMIIAGILTGIGVFLEVKSCMIPLPGEGVSVTIAQVFKLSFHKCKVGFDTFNIVLAAVISLVSMGGLIGVREGSIFMAVAVGYIVKIIGKLLPNFERFCPTEGMYGFGSNAA